MCIERCIGGAQCDSTLVQRGEGGIWGRGNTCPLEIKKGIHFRIGGKHNDHERVIGYEVESS